VTRPNAVPAKDQLERVEPVAHTDGVVHAAVVSKLSFELGDLVAIDEYPAFEHTCVRSVELLLELGMGFGEIEKGDLQLCAHGSDEIVVVAVIVGLFVVFRRQDHAHGATREIVDLTPDHVRNE